MAMMCQVCGKKPQVGRRISHAHNVTSRRFNPNLQRVHATVEGSRRHIRVCTRCIRSGRVEKVA